MVPTKRNPRDKPRGRLGRLKDEVVATWREIKDVRREADRALAQTKEEARDVQDAMRARQPATERARADEEMRGPQGP